MNYQAIYSALISKRKSKKPRAYSEKHHIVPRCIGGDNSKGNIVRLTAREHFIAHRLLARIYGGKLWAAVAIMSQPKTKSANGVRVTSRTYETAKAKDAEWRSEFYRGENNPWYGRTPSNETLDRMRGPRISSTGSNNHMWGKVRDNDTRWVISMVKSYRYREHNIDSSTMDMINAAIGIHERVNSRGERIQCRNKEIVRLNNYFRAMSIERRDIRGDKNPNYGNGQAISGEKNPIWGTVRSAETRAKISEKAKRVIQCPHCGKAGSISNMKRWHFDNCKVKND